MRSDLLHNDVAVMLQSHSHRYTTGRRRVVNALNSAGGPITIEEIIELDTGLALSSVYRNLTILENVEAVTRIITGDAHARFELAEALTDHHHHHLICTTCDAVIDFELAPDVEAALNQAFTSVDLSTRFRTDGHRLDLFGTCATCA